MTPSFLPRLDHLEGRLDLVDFGDFRAWMLADDNLYERFTDPAAKHASVDDHYRRFESDGFPRCPFADKADGETKLTREFGYQIIKTLIDHGVDFDLYDIGAFMGDQSLRYGSFLRTMGHTDARVFAIDPSLSGDLIPYNIALNALEPWIEFLPVAVGPVRGPLPFALSRGHTDSGRVATPGNAMDKGGALTATSLVQCVRLSDLIEEKQTRNAFLKLDLEGYDSLVMRQVWDFLKRSCSILAFELTVHDTEALDIAEELMEDYAVFDVGYFPNMFRTVRHHSRETLWWQAVRTSPYGYTDVIAIPKRLPGFDSLVAAAEQSLPVEPTHFMTWTGGAWRPPISLTGGA